MNDIDALQEIVHYHESINENNLLVILDTEYTVIYEDSYSAPLANTEGGSFLGRKLIPEIAKSSWRIDIISQALQNCYSSKKVSRWLSLRFSRQPEYWLLIQTYHPLVNQETQNIIGYKIIGEKPNFPLAYYRLDKLIEISQHREQIPTATEDFLEPLEHEILFLLFHCGSYEQIADLLTLANARVISKSVVAKTISRKLYPKFSVVNLEALKNKGYTLDYHKKLPYSLFGEFMFSLDEL